MQLKYLLASLAMASAAHMAEAKTTDWASHDPLEIITNVVTPGSFSDVINFTLGHADVVSSTTVSNNLASWLNITDGKVSLYKRATEELDPAKLLGSYAFDGTTGSITTSFSAPSAGNYFYLVQGIGKGTAGGVYALTSTALPEPQSWTLLAVGLVVGYTFYRRQARK